MSIEKTIEDFLERNGVTFELRAINSDGEVLISYTDDQSADNVSGYAGLIDEKMLQLSLDELNHRDDDEAEAIMQDKLEEALA